MIDQLRYDPECDRFIFDGYELHCGQPMSVLVVTAMGKYHWRDTRLEYSDEGQWYGVGLGSYQLAGMFAKIEG